MAECEIVAAHIEKVRAMIEKELETPDNYRGSLRGQVDDYLENFMPVLDKLKAQFEKNRSFWLG